MVLVLRVICDFFMRALMPFLFVSSSAPEGDFHGHPISHAKHFPDGKVHRLEYPGVSCRLMSLFFPPTNPPYYTMDLGVPWQGGGGGGGGGQHQQLWWHHEQSCGVS